VRYLHLDSATSQATERRLEERYGLALDEIDGTLFAPFVRAPVLVVHDHDDREVPFEHGARLAAALPHAALLETHGLGHRRVLKDANVIAEVTRFVASPFARPLAERIDDDLFDRGARVA
jgi:pimeloyl-ACP methyl ester carboxylesterase